MQQLDNMAENEDSDKESSECEPPLKAARNAYPVTTVASSLSNLFIWDLAKALEEVGEQSESDDELQTVARIRKWIDWIEMHNSVDRVNATMTVATAEDMSEKDHESEGSDESEEQDG